MDAAVTDVQSPRVSWVVFSYSLPQGNRASLRVSFWRRLRQIGAHSPKVGVHMLPSNDENIEAFDWMAQEANTPAATRSSCTWNTSKDCRTRRSSMHSTRRACKRTRNSSPTSPHWSTRYEALPPIRSSTDAARAAHAATPPVGRDARHRLLQKRAGQGLAMRLDAIQTRLRAPGSEDIMPASRQQYIGKTWVTRPRPFIDRLAHAWLIRRFIEEHARIRYSTDIADDEITFDMPDAVFGHRGDDCTFESMIKAFDVTMRRCCGSLRSACDRFARRALRRSRSPRRGSGPTRMAAIQSAG